ncbi:MAG TPA: hypothetical protein PL048_08030 [Leptospiraceae bacterium]|nr:hypothetical protein [Leptospiraceae bacterium]HNN05551.1 hypothetical protein [Leptospiraceae bacterium]
MKKTLLYLILAVSVCSGSACQEKKNSSKEAVLALLALSRSSAAGSASSSCTAYTCSGTTTFSTVSSSGMSSGCAQSGCHSAAAQTSGFNATDYASAKSFTVPGNACSSRLYSMVTVGSMAGNSDSALNKAIYCWIQGGSAQ